LVKIAKVKDHNIDPFLFQGTALGAGVYSLALYGGLILFGGFMLYDTQKIIYRAERHPTYGAAKFDPINNSIGIYADTLNIFIRIAQILAMQNGRRK
jgi:FtsH-binding integral membrane protein